ncbi:MAG: hypothetical protein LAN64_18470 [Acidobacteriia bacterium]|nr:hypothetical protein [Terriglobia bacterium]
MSDQIDPVVAPAAYKNRRGWLTFFGIIEILMGCVLLMLIALTAFALWYVPTASQPPADARSGLTVVAIFYGLLAVFFVAVGIGSAQARRWARLAMLVVSWAWLGIGVLAMAMLILIMPMITRSMRLQAKAAMPDNMETVTRIVIYSILGLFFILLPGIFLLFYSGKNVKATCERPGVPAGRRKPLGVVIVAVFFGFGAISCAFAVAVRPALPLFGGFVTGWAAWLAAVVMGIVSAWLAWNLYHQRSLAWKAAVAWLLLNWLSTLVTMSRTSLLQMYQRMGYGETEISRMMPFVKYGVYGGWIIGLAFFAYLLAIRKHFAENSSSSVPRLGAADPLHPSK